MGLSRPVTVPNDCVQLLQPIQGSLRGVRHYKRGVIEGCSKLVRAVCATLRQGYPESFIGQQERPAYPIEIAIVTRSHQAHRR